MRPCVTLDRARTPEGELLLQRHGDDEFVIGFPGRVVMGSRAHRSEKDLAALACEGLAEAPAPRVVVAGLGMGYTLRAALDLLPPTASALVVELVPAVVTWCRGPLAHLSGDALADPRVTARTGDVFAALAALDEPVDAVALDLWQGPLERNDPVFDARALRACRGALRRGGRLAVWSEQEVPSFPRRLAAAGFAEPTRHVAKRGVRYVVYVARAAGAAPPRGGVSRGA